MPADYDFTLGKNCRLRGGNGLLGLAALSIVLSPAAVFGIWAAPAGAWLLQLLKPLLGA